MNNPVKNHKSDKIEWIQSLRGIAALAVVLAHARVFLLATDSYTADTLFRPGAMAVDLFFIISGFIMAHTTHNAKGGIFCMLSFFAKRLSKIWPSYVLATFIFITIDGKFFYYLSQDNYFNFVKSLFFIPFNYDKPLFFAMPLPPSWTLLFEFYFYIIFGVSIAFKKHRYCIILSYFAITLIFIPAYFSGFHADVFYIGISNKFHYYKIIGNPIIFEFIFGILLAQLYKKNIILKSKILKYNIQLTSVGIFAWGIFSKTAEIHGPTQWGGFIAILLTAYIITMEKQGANTHPIMHWLGEISYSLYLTHLIVFNLLIKLLDRLNHHELINTWAQFILATVMSVVFSSMWFYFIERNVTSILRKTLLRFILRYHKNDDPC